MKIQKTYALNEDIVKILEKHKGHKNRTHYLEESVKLMNRTLNTNKKPLESITESDLHAIAEAVAKKLKECETAD